MHATHNDLSNPKSAHGGELTIGELLADPMTQAAMKADRVDAMVFVDMLRSVAGRLRAGPIAAPRTSGKPRPSMEGYAPWPSVERLSELAKTRSGPEVVAAKAAKLACGSHCAW